MSSVDVTSKRIVICGSMSFYKEMLECRAALDAVHLGAVSPEPDSILMYEASETDYGEAKRRASLRHIRRIRDDKTFAILVMNFDKYGVPDYIGANSFAEIAVAVAHYKRVFLWQGIPESYADELRAWQATPLYRSLDVLIAEFELARMLSKQQLKLF